MLLQNSQLIIQIVLIIVIITGIISSRLIVKRLKVIRESYASLNEMVGALDSSIEQADKIFDTLRREVSKGDKRLSALLDDARNMEEDLSDQYKMAQEASASWEGVFQKEQEREKSLSRAANAAQDIIEALQKRMDMAERTTQNMVKLLEEIEAKEAELRVREEEKTKASETVGNRDEGDAKIDVAAPGESEVVEDVRHADEAVEQGQTPRFVDDIAMPMPETMRGPRPYLRRNSSVKEKTEE